MRHSNWDSNSNIRILPMLCRRCGCSIERQITLSRIGESRTLSLYQLKSDYHSSEDFLAGRQGRFAEAILSGDSFAAMQIVDELLVTRQTLGDIYLRVIGPSLVNLGDSWCRGDVSTGEEKLATQIVLDQMDRLRALFVVPAARSPYRVMV